MASALPQMPPPPEDDLAAARELVRNLPAARAAKLSEAGADWASSLRPLWPSLAAGAPTGDPAQLREGEAAGGEAWLEGLRAAAPSLRPAGCGLPGAAAVAAAGPPASSAELDAALAAREEPDGRAEAVVAADGRRQALAAAAVAASADAEQSWEASMRELEAPMLEMAGECGLEAAVLAAELSLLRLLALRRARAALAASPLAERSRLSAWLAASLGLRAQGLTGAEHFERLIDGGKGQTLCAAIFYKLAEELVDLLKQRAWSQRQGGRKLASVPYECVRGELPRSELARKLLTPDRVATMLDQGFVVFDASPACSPEFWEDLRREVDWLQAEVCEPQRSKWAMRPNACTQHSGYQLPVGALAGAAAGRCPALSSTVSALHGCAAEVASHPDAPESLQQLCVPLNFMVSDYGPGDHYRMHLDSHGPEENPRGVTLLLYLNPDWEEGDGGLLRGYYSPEEPEPCFELEPRLGAMCAFLSRELWHEVTEQAADREGRPRPRRKALQYWIHLDEE